MKKIISIVLACIMLLCITGCNSQTNDQTFKVGVVQLVQHEALDAATKGFEDALKAELGDKVSIDVQNASGEAANCATIVNGFVSSNVNLIMANATPALQAAAAATADIPVLGTSITDYASALELDSWSGVIGNNVSGTSDLAPLDQQAKMIVELFPNVKNVGIVFCSSEANSRYQVDVITAELQKLGANVSEFAFTDTNDVAAVTQAACDASDVIYIPTDNTAASNTEAIGNVVIPAGVPVVTGEEGICRGCGVATLTISYYDLGYTTGLQAVKILKGEAKVSEMAIEYASTFTKKYNATICSQLGITVPSDYESLD